MNEVMWFIFAIVQFLMLIGVYKLFGKSGLFIWIVIGTILANIQVTKTISLFGLEATLGNITYGTVFLATNVLSEKYSKKEGYRGVIVGFLALIITLVLTQMMLVFTPSNTDKASPALEIIFGFLPRVALGSLVAYLVSQLLDVYLFSKIKEKLPSTKHMFIRNNCATFISQLVDTFIFVPIAFLGIYPSNVFWSILITTYFIKVIVALLDTPFLYLSKLIKPLND